MSSQRRLNEKEQEKIMVLILNKQENKLCADCNAKSPQWASIDFGILICMNCAGAHRAIGPQNTRVRSAKLDVWQEDQVEFISHFNNIMINSYFESNIQSNFMKPSSNAGQNELLNFVKNKYLKKLWVNQSLTNPLEYFIQNGKLPDQYINSQQQGNQQSQKKQNIPQQIKSEQQIKKSSQQNQAKVQQFDLMNMDFCDQKQDFKEFQFSEQQQKFSDIFDNNKKVKDTNDLFEMNDNIQRKNSNSHDGIVQKNQDFNVLNLYEKQNDQKNIQVNNIYIQNKNNNFYNCVDFDQNKNQQPFQQQQQNQQFQQQQQNQQFQFQQQNQQFQQQNQKFQQFNQNQQFTQQFQQFNSSNSQQFQQQQFNSSNSQQFQQNQQFNSSNSHQKSQVSNMSSDKKPMDIKDIMSLY